MCSEVGRLGACRRNLLQHLKADLCKRFILLESYDDILNLRELASYRGYWSKMFNFILEYESNLLLGHDRNYNFTKDLVSVLNDICKIKMFDNVLSCDFPKLLYYSRLSLMAP